MVASTISSVFFGLFSQRQIPKHSLVYEHNIIAILAGRNTVVAQKCRVKESVAITTLARRLMKYYLVTLVEINVDHTSIEKIVSFVTQYS